MKNTYSTLAIVVALWGAGCSGAMSPAFAPPTRPLTAKATSPAAKKAHEWLRSRIHPTTHLAASFESTGPEGDMCVTYDQAVAIDAFLVMGDVASAREVLDGMKAAQNPSGTWWTIYTCSTAKVFEHNETVGQTIWMALAVAKYEQLTGDVTSYHAMGKAALDWAYTFQAPDGGVNGGLEWGIPAKWAGTEFNEDVYAASRYFGGHDPEMKRVRDFIDRQTWDDKRDPLDVNAWSVQSLGPGDGAHSYAKTLDYNLAHHRVTIDSIDAFDFNSDKNDIWFEGTGEMILSLEEVGRQEEADHFLKEMIKAQRPNGGVPYSLRGTFNDYWQMTAAPCISSTGWLIIAEGKENPFRFTADTR
jgi:hypothetical protein